MKNETTIMGHVGSVRLGKTENNLDVLGIDVAINRKVGDKEYVDWVKVKVWGVLATKLEPHIQKGDKLLVSGRVEAKGYLRADGTAGADLVLHASNVELLTAPKAKVDHSSEDENS